MSESRLSIFFPPWGKYQWTLTSGSNFSTRHHLSLRIKCEHNSVYTVSTSHNRSKMIKNADESCWHPIFFTRMSSMCWLYTPVFLNIIVEKSDHQEGYHLVWKKVKKKVHIEPEILSPFIHSRLYSKPVYDSFIWETQKKIFLEMRQWFWDHTIDVNVVRLQHSKKNISCVPHKKKVIQVYKREQDTVANYLGSKMFETVCIFAVLTSFGAASVKGCSAVCLGGSRSPSWCWLTGQEALALKTWKRSSHRHWQILRARCNNINKHWTVTWLTFTK